MQSIRRNKKGEDEGRSGLDKTGKGKKGKRRKKKGGRGRKKRRD